jgi:hypothetical protein
MQLVPPFFPAGPTYKTIAVNAATVDVTSLKMIFENHTFSFPNVTAQSPLLPGQSTYSNFTYIGGFPNLPAYSIVVYGTFQGNADEPFAYVETVQLM